MSMNDSMTTVFAIDRAGRRRLVGPNEVLADGERLTVQMVAMDSAPPEPPSQQMRDAAYQQMVERLQYGGREVPETTMRTPQQAYDAMVQQLDRCSRGVA
jgi:hypothetical protein